MSDWEGFPELSNRGFDEDEWPANNDIDQKPAAQLKDDRDYDDEEKVEEGIGDEYEEDYNDMPQRGGGGDEDFMDEPPAGGDGGGARREQAANGSSPPRQKQNRRPSKDPFEDVEGARRRASGDPFQGGGSQQGSMQGSRDGSQQGSQAGSQQGGRQGSRPPGGPPGRQGSRPPGSGPPGRQGSRPPGSGPPGRQGSRPPGSGPPGRQGSRPPGGPPGRQGSRPPGGSSGLRPSSDRPSNGPPGQQRQRSTQQGGPPGQGRPQGGSGRGPPPPGSQQGGPRQSQRPRSGAPRQKSEKNPRFQDVEKTGKWGSSLTKWEIGGIVACIFIVIIAVVLVVVFVVVKPGEDSGSTNNVVQQPSSARPTAAPTTRDSYAYRLIRQASPGVEWPGDPLTLQDMVAAGGGMYVMPQYRAAHFVLYEDPNRINPGNHWFLQRYGLYTLWLTLGGDRGWTNNWNWANSANPCDTFHGVECDLAQQYVTKLDLGKNGLSTTKPNQSGAAAEGIPYELSTLTEATQVEFDDNDIGGPLPALAIIDMKKLSTFTVKRNRLTGTIPAALAESSLTFLSLDENQLVGNVPEEFCDNNGITTVVVNCQDNDCFCCRGPFCE